MQNIVKTILGRDDRECQEVLSLCLNEDNKKLFNKEEQSIMEYLNNTYQVAGKFPTEELFGKMFEAYVVMLKGANVMNMHDLKVYLATFLAKRRNQYAAKEFMRMSAEVNKEGVSDDHFELVRDLYRETTEYDVIELESLENIQSMYQKRKTSPTGLLTFVTPIDEIIGGLTKGTVNFIIGWTGSFKTTWALNIAYNNSFKLNYNVVYISLEVPKEDIYYNLISRHSYEPKFDKYPFIGHDKLRKCLLNKEEEDYAMNVVAKDLLNSKGKLMILDETDFKSFSFAEIRVKLEEVDDFYIKETGSGIDAIFWDHANLFKFTGAQAKNKTQGDIINDYISFIRKLSIGFRKDKNTGEFSQLCNIVVAQCNREGWKKAVRNKGMYELTAISEANEIERAGYRILSVFSDDNLKRNKEASVQLLKNRTGRTISSDTVRMFVDPEAYVAGSDLESFAGDVMSSTNINDILGDTSLDALLR